MVMTPRLSLISRIDDGSDCWMNPVEAAVYTRTSIDAVKGALLAGDLEGAPIPGGGLADSLAARRDLDRWVARRIVRGQVSA
jgi:hypothetical protein